MLTTAAPPDSSIFTHSLGTITAPPQGWDCHCAEVGYDADAACSICRLPFGGDDATDTLTLEPCKHRFHVMCIQKTKTMYTQHTGYSNSARRRPHCPLCRTTTTTRVPVRKPLREGTHRKALADPASDLLYRFPVLHHDKQQELWQLLSTSSLPLTAEELVPLAQEDARWGMMVRGQTPLYVPAVGVHGTFVYTTQTQVRMRVYPEGTERRFGKNRVAGVAASWAGLLPTEGSAAAVAETVAPSPQAVPL